MCICISASMLLVLTTLLGGLLAGHSSLFAAIWPVGRWNLYKMASDSEEPILSSSGLLEPGTLHNYVMLIGISSWNLYLGRIKSNSASWLTSSRKHDKFWCCNTRTLFFKLSGSLPLWTYFSVLIMLVTAIFLLIKWMPLVMGECNMFWCH